jgi:uncharacterized protein
MTLAGVGRSIIERAALVQIEAKLDRNVCVVILGPRQTGKTTLAKMIADGRNSAYVDLSQPTDRQQLASPEIFFAKNAGLLMVFDECQEMPEIFSFLKSQIDIDRSGNLPSRSQFLVLGSASRTISDLAAKHLVGRHEEIVLPPLQANEILSDATLRHRTIAAEPAIGGATSPISLIEPQLRSENPQNLLDKLWLKGGYPQSYCSLEMDESKSWRTSYLQTYYGHDFSKAGIILPKATIQRFFNEISLKNGQPKCSKLARSLSLGFGVADRMLEAFEDVTFVRRLAAYENSALKALEARPKLFIRDTGLLHSVLGIDSMEKLLSHQSRGLSWEGFVIESLAFVDTHLVKPYHYRYDNKDEIDLVLKFDFDDGECWGIEIKSGIEPRTPDGFKRATKQISCTRRFMIKRGSANERHDGIEEISLAKMIDVLGNFVRSAKVK